MMAAESGKPDFPNKRSCSAVRGGAPSSFMKVCLVHTGMAELIGFCIFPAFSLHDDFAFIVHVF